MNARMTLLFSGILIAASSGAAQAALQPQIWRKARMMGLGALHTVSLQEARIRARQSQEIHE